MRKHTIVVGLGFGDEGKGTMTEYFARTRNAGATIRFNGGQQAAHNVVLADGTHHTFSQFGSATLAGIPSYISRFCTFEPFNMYEEAEALFSIMGTNPYDLLGVSENALVTTPLHTILNHAREAARGNAVHGSVGVGFGETISYSLTNPEDAIRGGDLRRPNTLMRKLKKYREYMDSTGLKMTIDIPPLEQVQQHLLLATELLRLVEDSEILDVIRNTDVVFEGAQGLLLDEWYGFHPHTTWSTTTPKNARILLEEAGELGNETVVGVIRSYYTRHGAGPFPTEDMYPKAPAEVHNGDHGMQGAWRKGAFDLPLFQYALDVVQPDEVAVTFADYCAPVMDGPAIQMPSLEPSDARLDEQEMLGLVVAHAERVERPMESPAEFLDLVQEMSGVDRLYISVGPTMEDKSDLDSLRS